MDIKDLMLGDLVYANKNPIHVTAATMKLMLEDDKFAEALKPIPLKPEILEKNGFKEYKPNDFRLFKPIFFNPKEYRDSDNYIRIFFTSKGFCFRTGNNLSVVLKNGFAINNIPCYVHQLQHALRLCGIEKEVVV